MLISEWHKEKFNKYFATDSLLTKFKNRFLKRKVSDLATDSLQSQFKSTLLKNCRKIIKHSSNFFATIARLLIHDVEDCDHKLPDHNSAVPYLDYFLFSLATLLNPEHKKLDKVLNDKNVFAYFWHKKNILFESGHVTASQQVLSLQTAKVGRTVVTTCDINSILHCLPHMQDPHTMVLDKCHLGKQAVRELSKFLAADSWTNDYSGITHLW